MIRILLVDDERLVRTGLRMILDGEVDLEVVGEAADGAEALALVDAFEPDVVLMDLRMPRMDGVTATERLATTHPAVRVLVLTTYDTESDILRALEAGARGYLLKDAPPEELFAGIRATARGETVLAPSVAATLVRRATPGAITITEREVEVLELLARGLGNKELARELFVSEATVKSHLSHIYAKLGVDTRAGAVAAAIERRIIRH